MGDRLEVEGCKLLAWLSTCDVPSSCCGNSAKLVQSLAAAMADSQASHWSDEEHGHPSGRDSGANMHVDLALMLLQFQSFDMQCAPPMSNSEKALECFCARPQDILLRES